MGEAHGLDWVQLLIMGRLMQYRQTFPERKILLAMEFQPDSFFIKADPSRKPMAQLSVYSLLTDVALTRGIDVMGLESPQSCLLGQDEDGRCVSAVIAGQEVILDRPCAMKARRFKPTDYEEDFVECATSDWGMQARNRHWVKQIKARQNDYDVIFVHAGAGHLDRRYPFSVPTLLKSQNEISFVLAYNPYTSKLDNWLLRRSYQKDSRRYGSYAIVAHTLQSNNRNFLLIRPRPGSTPGIRQAFGFDAWVIFPKDLIRA